MAVPCAPRIPTRCQAAMGELGESTSPLTESESRVRVTVTDAPKARPAHSLERVPAHTARLPLALDALRAHVLPNTRAAPRRSLER